MKNVLNYIKIYIIMILVFITGLTLVALIPQENIKNNVKKSLETLEKENLAQEVGIIKKTILDDFTDALMINISYSLDTKNPIKAIMEDNFGHEERNVIQYKPVKDLKYNIENEDISYTNYSRYWHGYLIYLKPLLVIMDYTKIRILFTIILSALAIRQAYLLNKKMGKAYAIIFLIALFIVSYFYCGLSLTYFPVLAISIITSIYIVKKEKTNYTMFFVIGGLTSFFDLLTTPLLTLGLPILMYLIINKKEIKYKEIMIFTINWICGYGLIWASKWIISSIILNQNVIENALKALLKRSRSYDSVGQKLTLFDTIMYNITNILYELFFIVFLTITALIIAQKEKINISKKEIGQYLLISILPIIWYSLTINHSCIHPKFTYRNMLITILALSTLSYKIIEKSIHTKIS